jgi:ABC-type multidrug transport system ATPase subunit
MTVLDDQHAAAGPPADGDSDDEAWVIKVEGLGKIYGPGGVEAVEGTGPEFGRTVSPLTGAVVAAWDVDFDVVPGEALGVIGESGSGKSSVMRCIAGDVRATAGDVRLRSVDDGASNILRLSPG